MLFSFIIINIKIKWCKYKMLPLKQVQGNVAVGSGMPKQIIYPRVGFVDKKFDSGRPRYELTTPVPDDRLRRPGYTNNVNVLIDLEGQKFEFPAPLDFQPHSTDIDIAHSVLDRMRDRAHAGGVFQPERPPMDEITFLIRQQQKEHALETLAAKEKELLKEGFSPEEIDAATYHDRARIMRRAILPVEARLMAEYDLYPADEVGEAGIALRVGVPAIGEGVRAPGIPALSVRGMFAPSVGGGTDFMGRNRPNGVRSQGFVSLKAPTTDSSDSYLSSGRSMGAPASMRSRGSHGSSASDAPSRVASLAGYSAYGSFGGTPDYMSAASSRRSDMRRGLAPPNAGR